MKQTVKTSRAAGQLEKMFRELNKHYYNGELPEECRFMEKLSEKFHENPDFGKVIRDVGQYLGFSQR